jgi:glutamine amidotransferase
MSAVAIVDNGGANIASLRYALGRLGVESQLTSDAAQLRVADRVILPGVGAASDAMTRLRALGLDETIRSLEQPVLGICLGMQLLFRASEEAEGAAETPCLGLIDERVRRMSPRRDLPVPHMGWNRLSITRRGGLLEGIDDGAHVYFVHSFAAPDGPWSIATCDYGVRFAAVIQHRNFHGTQFHPERSAGTGSRLLANFLGLH